MGACLAALAMPHGFAQLAAQADHRDGVELRLRVELDCG